MIRPTRAIFGGLDKYKFIGPKWSKTRQKNRIKRLKQEQGVIATLREAKKADEAFKNNEITHPGYFHIKLTRSTIGRSPEQRKMLQVLSLRKINTIVERVNEVATRTMVNKIRHMVTCHLSDKANFPREPGFKKQLKKTTTTTTEENKPQPKGYEVLS